MRDAISNDVRTHYNVAKALSKHMGVVMIKHVVAKDCDTQRRLTQSILLKWNRNASK
ncbi:MAG: hypothetical protein PVS3B3_00650 [Ktedonobacteraceae bacterium]